MSFGTACNVSERTNTTGQPTQDMTLQNGSTRPFTLDMFCYHTSTAQYGTGVTTYVCIVLEPRNTAPDI